MFSHSSLVICTFNINSLYLRLHEFREFVDRRSPHIILLQETKLRFSAKPPTVVNYNCYYVNKDTTPAGGGVAIYVKKTVTHYQKQLPNLRIAEAVGITITPTNLAPITIISTYVPPYSHRRKTSFPADDIKKLITLSSEETLMQSTHYGTEEPAICTDLPYTLSRSKLMLQ